MKKRNIICLALIAAGAAVSDPPNRQSGIDGFVTSDIQAVVQGAAIGVDGLAIGTHRQTSTDGLGHYMVDNLRPGAYSVWAEIKGYGCIVYPHVVVAEGAAVREDFHFARTKRSPGNCEPLKTH